MSSREDGMSCHSIPHALWTAPDSSSMNEDQIPADQGIPSHDGRIRVSPGSNTMAVVYWSVSPW